MIYISSSDVSSKECITDKFIFPYYNENVIIFKPPSKSFNGSCFRQDYESDQTFHFKVFDSLATYNTMELSSSKVEHFISKTPPRSSSNMR